MYNEKAFYCLMCKYYILIIFCNGSSGKGGGLVKSKNLIVSTVTDDCNRYHG